MATASRKSKINKQCTLDDALHCAKCDTKASYVEEHSGSEFSPGEIVLITCANCKEKPWFWCKSCKIRCYMNGLGKHAARKRHQTLHAAAYPPPPPAAQANHEASKTNGQENIPTFPEPDGMEVAMDDIDDIMDMDDFANATIEHELESTHIENALSPMEVTINETATANSTPAGSPSGFTKINWEGNEWLQDLLKDTPRATMQEVFRAFGRPELQHMKDFWVAELGSGENRCGGGLMFLAARAFQQAKTAQLDAGYPDLEEARWQVNQLIQYQSMNERQRRRQARLNQTLMSFFPEEIFFKKTFLPSYKHLGKYYGSTGQHSMWNNLPCPKPIDVDGVAYVSPKAVITFLMANGVPIDDFVVTADTPALNEPDDIRWVHDVDKCQKSVDWIRSIQETYYGSKNGAPNSNSNSGAPKYPAVICLHLSDWTDGFDSAKVKSNRNAIDSKTFTISPPKCLINGTENTFAVGLGLKKAKGWQKVAKLFRQEVDELVQSPEPILFYHGVLQKMVPCVFKQYAVLSDKQERNGLTGTLGCGGDTHRCFGVSGKILTPSCNIHELQDFFREEQKGQNKPEYGWSEEFIVRQDSNNLPVNGAVFPSCKCCRKAGLCQLLGMAKMNMRLDKPCKNCSNWDLVPEGNDKGLVFPAHKDYPRRITKGSPVPPPKGRDVFKEGEFALPFMRITWETMKLGCKFAFYQASRPKDYWTKASTLCYLKHCGVSSNLAELLHDAARACCKAKEQNSVDYGAREGIGMFQFHPAWLSDEVSLQDFIEAIMHQLFLGATESNFELIGLWLSSTPSAAKLGYSSFLNTLQALLKDLRVFNLSWLQAYPLTGKKGKLGTGSWVAENWGCFNRISQYIFGWCCRDEEIASKYGVEDMSRVVIAFHCFCARCLTHSGINGQSIDETELYMKEFLSALRELDVRVRHSKLNKAVQKLAERKGTESWWLKPNYMSLPNLVLMMRILGPLVLWWDGGGKGERFIQVVKPHIKKGVREDAISFFVSLLEKLFRVRQLELFEKRFRLSEDDHSPLSTEEEEALDILNQIAETLFEDDGNDEATTTTTASRESEEESEGHEEDIYGEEDDDDDDGQDVMSRFKLDEAYFSTNEVHGMTKSKTIFVYRNEKQLTESITLKKPLAGIVQVRVNEEGETAFEFFTVFRKPVKQFARRRVSFDDAGGLSFHGLWCAAIEVEEEEIAPTTKFGEIQESAKLSAVAIPLWYILGKNSPHSHKYCVITNWWKYRMSDGVYRLPSLDPKLYAGIQAESFLEGAAMVPENGAATTGII